MQRDNRELKKPCFFAATATWVTEWDWEEYGVVPVKIRKLSKAKRLTGASMKCLNLCFVHTVNDTTYDRVRPFILFWIYPTTCLWSIGPQIFTIYRSPRCFCCIINQGRRYRGGQEGLQVPTSKVGEQGPFISIEKPKICIFIFNESWHMEEMWRNIKWKKSLRLKCNNWSIKLKLWRSNHGYVPKCSR